MTLRMTKRWLHITLLTLALVSIHCIDSSQGQTQQTEDLGDHLHSRIHHRYHNGTMHQSFDRGYVICGGDKFQADIIRLYYQLRFVYQSYLPMLLVHCNEIEPHSKLRALLSHFDHRVIIYDMCDVNQKVFPNSYHQQLKADGSNLTDSEKIRLQGYFCKPAALIVSPFIHNIILDLDTVWFRSPETLLSYPKYEWFGGLIFRDRITPYSPIDYDQVINKYRQAVNNSNLEITSELASELYSVNESYNFFWGHYIYPLYPKIAQVQDSSCVLVNKLMKGKFIEELRRQLFTFDIGFGEKEIFWISALLSNETLMWEPFVAGTFGGCDGLITHFNPLDAFPDSRSPHPNASLLYMNGEGLVESVSVIGDNIKEEVYGPILASAVLRYPYYVKVMYFDKLSDVACECGARKGLCRHKVTENEIMMIVISQWITLTNKLKPSKAQCIWVRDRYLPLILDYFGRRSDVNCAMTGCPHPSMHAISAHSSNKTCIKVYFGHHLFTSNT